VGALGVRGGKDFCDPSRMRNRRPGETDKYNHRKNDMIGALALIASTDGRRRRGQGKESVSAKKRRFEANRKGN